MINVKSYIANPLLEPDPQHDWENAAAFNGSVIKHQDKYYMVYRAVGKNNISTIGMAVSDDKYSFIKRKQLLTPEFDWEKYGLEDPRIVKVDDTFYLFYTAISTDPPGPNGIKVAVAVSKDLVNWEKHLVTQFNAKAMVLFPKRINGKLVGMLTVDTDRPPSRIGLITFDREDQIWDQDYWRSWYWRLDENAVRLERVNSDMTEIGAVPIETSEGWLLIYSHIENYFAVNKAAFGIEAALLDINNPRKITAQTKGPLMVPQEDFELAGAAPNIIFPSGALLEHNQIYIYYGAADNFCALATINLTDLLEELRSSGAVVPQLKKYEGNPIITPRSEKFWESKATFNPGAIEIEGRIYIIYRAMSQDNISVLGLAETNDGFNIEYRSEEPIYKPREMFESKNNPNNFSGCEDPRLVRIGDRIYMCYTAFDGVKPPKIALTSILVSDLVKHNWNWKKPVVISEEGEDDKDGSLFPEKIGNKFIFFHRARGKCMVMSFLSQLDFENGEKLKEDACLVVGTGFWEDSKTGIAAPPLKTEDGWLVLYHGVSETDHGYRVGAMLLDLEDPLKVIATSQFPILEPELWYEKTGEVSNVVFPCGAVIKKGELLVYYGGADKVIGVAMGNVKEILQKLQKVRALQEVLA